jgi:hypothetical protein
VNIELLGLDRSPGEWLGSVNRRNDDAQKESRESGGAGHHQHQLKLRYELSHGCRPPAAGDT